MTRDGYITHVQVNLEELIVFYAMCIATVAMLWTALLSQKVLEQSSNMTLYAKVTVSNIYKRNICFIREKKPHMQLLTHAY